MASDFELFELNQKGWIPGPGESEEHFLSRIQSAKEFFKNPPEELEAEERVSSVHWDWARLHLKELYDFEPESLFAYYSNRELAPWQGAASWIFENGLCALQLKKGFRKGRYLGLYSRDEILAHEAVHAARSAFHEPESEEFFAYLSSPVKWRRVLGPIVRRPWEVFLFFAALCLGIFSGQFLPAAILLFGAFLRLGLQHRRLSRAAKTLRRVASEKKIPAILLRLTDREIAKLSDGKMFEEDGSLRHRIIRFYLNN